MSRIFAFFSEKENSSGFPLLEHDLAQPPLYKILSKTIKENISPRKEDLSPCIYITSCLHLYGIRPPPLCLGFLC